MRPNSKCDQFYNFESYKEVEHTVVISVLVVIGALLLAVLGLLLLAILLVGHGGSLGINLLLRGILQRTVHEQQEARRLPCSESYGYGPINQVSIR